MRIDRLDLTRYGAFTDRRLEFAKPRDGAPDLHIVFGPNEAGKSTLFAAWLDLLFGTKAARYDFQHRDGLEIGARIALNGEALEWRRSGTGKGSALRVANGSGDGTGGGSTGGGGAVDPADLAAALGGLGREDYGTMFSLDAGELEEGGRAILSSEGRLGELLFSAGSGLSGLSDILVKAQDDANALFRSGGSKHELAQLKKSLVEIEERIKDTDTRTDEYERMIAARDEALQLYEKAKSEQREVVQRLRTVERTLEALLSDDKRREAQRRIDELGPLPEAPIEWGERADALIGSQARFAERERQLREGRARLARQRDELVPDDRAVGVAASLQALSRADGEDGVDPEARIRTATADLPRREAELAARNETLREKVAVLRGSAISDAAKGDASEGDAVLRDWIAAFVPSPVTVRRWHGLLNDHTREAATLRSARQEAETARKALAELEDERALFEDQDGPTQEAIDALDRLGKRLRRGSAHVLLADLDKRVRRASADLDRALQAKGLEGPALLDRLPPPSPDDLQRWTAELDALALRDERLKERRDELVLRSEILNAERAAFTVPSDVDAREAREARDEAWARHRVERTEDTATLFESALRRDDDVTKERLEGAAELAEQRQTERELLRLKAETRRLDGRSQEIERERDAIQERIASAAASLLAHGVVEEASPPKLARYAEAHAALLKERAALEALEADRFETAREVEEATETLMRALDEMEQGGGSSSDGDLDALLDRTESAVATWRRRGEERSRMAARLEKARAELHARKDAIEREERHHQAWAAQWREATAGTFLADHPSGDVDGAGFDAEAAAALADEARELHTALSEVRQLDHRITRMRADRDDFLLALAPIAETLGFEAPTPRTWVSVLENARKRVALALDTRNVLDRLAVETKTLNEEEATLERERGAHNTALAGMAAVLGTHDPGEMRQTLQAVAERDRWRKTRDEAASNTARTLRAAPNEVEPFLDGADRDDLGTEARSLEAENERLTEEVDKAHAELVLARNALERIGGDGAAARLLSERQSLVTRMEETARAALRLEFGIEAARRALHRYREAHRSDMMARASDAFAAISCGAFEGLATRPDGEDDCLVGLRVGGSPVAVGPSSRAGRGKKGAGDEGGLSKGTRHQLYLALRIAGYHEFARRRTPPPFLCDDIMETFDDERAEATLRLLGDMAGHGQVIVLTHHRHLADIARSVVPGTQVHDLPGVTAPIVLSEAAE